MLVQGQHLVNAAVARVYEALNDPAILRQAIPGCDKLLKTADDEYDAHLKLGIASIKGSYVGKVKLSDKHPPHKFTLHMEGKGGPGFVKGSTTVELKEHGAATKLAYHGQVQVGGLIAAIGSRLLDAVSKKLAGDFFKKFGELVEAAK